MSSQSLYEQMNVYTRSGKKITLTDKILDLMVRGVYVVTTRCKDEINGMTAAMVMRASADPVYLMVGVWHENYSQELIRKAENFAVNILSEDNIDLAKHFGRQSGKEVNKFIRQDIYWESKRTGAPILLDTLAYLDCRLVDSYDPPGGDHTIFVGEVLDAGILCESNPLRYQRQDYPYRVLHIQE